MPSQSAFDAKAFSRKNMLARHGMTEADLDPKSAVAEREAAELAGLPKTLEEAGGDARVFMKADMRRRVAAKAGKGPTSLGRESMARILRASGREPVGG